MARRILLLTGLACLSLPFFHAAVFGLNTIFYWADPESIDLTGTWADEVLNGIRLLSGFAIPTFLFVGGYFVVMFARGKDLKKKYAAVRTQALRLLPPFLIWTTIHFILQFQPPKSISEVLHPYYFLPLMLQFYFLAPVLVSICERASGWKWVLGFSIALHLFLETIRYLPVLGVSAPPLLRGISAATPTWFFPEHLLWFVMGIVVKMRFAEFKESFLYNRLLWLGLLIVFGVLSIVESEYLAAVRNVEWLGVGFNGLSREIYSASVLMFFVVNEGLRIPFEKFFSYLGGKSMAVYLTNSPTIYLVASLLFKFTPWVLGSQLIYQFILVGVGLGIPLLIIYVVDHTRLRIYHRFVLG